MVTKTPTRIVNFVLPILFLILGILIWAIIIQLFHIPQYLLPSPLAIISDFFGNFSSLLYHAGVTLCEAIIGFLIANLLGMLVAVGFAHSETLEKGAYPYAIALKTTPVVAMAPLLLLWFGNGIWSKVASAALISFFPAIVNTTKGLKSVDVEAMDLFKSLSATKWQIFTKLRLPTALPYIFSALKISTSLAIVGAIVGEFVGANRGIGYLILISSYHLETVKMFSAVIAAALSGILFFSVIAFLERRLVFWIKIDE